MRLQKACQLYSLCPRLSRTRQVVSPSPGNMLQHMGQNRDSVLLSLDCTSFRRCMGHTAAIPRRATTPLLRSHEFSLPPLQVRPHEVDQYSVVNNAVFVQYLQHARHAWLQAEDLEDRKEIPAYALSELNVKYIAPLRSRDEYIATVGIKEYSRTRVVCAQRIIRVEPGDEQLDRVVVEALATVVLLDAKYRPLRMPAFFKAAMSRYQEPDS